VSIHPRILLKGAAALLALLLSALVAPRAVAGCLGADSDPARPAITSPLTGAVHLRRISGLARPLVLAAYRAGAVLPGGRTVPAPSRRHGSAGGPRAP
jgi:hypothetical protein